MRLEVRDGARSKADVQPLFHRVYSERVLSKAVWRSVVSAPADERIVMLDESETVVATAGLVFRTGLRDSSTVRIGGVGGVMVLPELQGKGLGRTTMLAAGDVLRSRSDLDFAMLFCDPHDAGFYQRVGWSQFDGTLRADQHGGSIVYDIMHAMTSDLATSAPKSGSIDLCGLPW